LWKQQFQIYWLFFERKGFLSFSFSFFFSFLREKIEKENMRKQREPREGGEERKGKKRGKEGEERIHVVGGGKGDHSSLTSTLLGNGIRGIHKTDYRPTRSYTHTLR
jgi:hypothetical protein